MGLFKDYLSEADSGYKYIFKTILPLDVRAVDRIKGYLGRYDILDFSDMRQTPIQKQPLEFYGMTNSAVWIIDFQTRIPVSKDVISRELADMFGVASKYFVIRSEGEPIELEQTNLEELDNEEEYTIRITDSEYSECDEDIVGEDYYGDKYNDSMLSTMQKVRAEMKAKLEKQSEQFRGDE